MLGLLLGMEYGDWFAAGSGENPDGWEFAPLNVRQVSIFFTVYVFFQVWNQINCRSLTPETSGFYRLFANPTFLAIAGTDRGGAGADHQRAVPGGGLQGRAAGPGRLAACIVAGTASVLVFAEAWRRVRLAAR